MRILVYVRKWNKSFYLKLIQKAFDNPEIDIISDFRSVGDIWSGQYIYNSDYDYLNELYEREKEDIITRCRFLRSISQEKAEELSRRFWNGIEQLYKLNNYTIVVSAIIDCYTMDIIERIAKCMGCQYFSLVTFFAKGYSRFTRRGELYNAKRNVSDEEAYRVLAMLIDDSYKVNFALNKEKKIIDTIKYYIRRRLIEQLYFPFMKWKEKDPWNYHYNTFSFIEGSYKEYDIRKAEAYYKKIVDLKIQGDEVYVPLHYAPEATVDYWCDQAKYALYEDSVIEFIQNSDSVIKFLLKEHPAMYGKRAISFYRRLVACGNVVIIHPYENSNLLMRQVYNVLVYTGSVGVEALLRGKKIFSVTDNYYSDICTNIVKVSKIRKVDLALENIEIDSLGVMRKILQGVFPANSMAGLDIDNSDLEKVAVEMRRIYKNNV